MRPSLLLTIILLAAPGLVDAAPAGNRASTLCAINGKLKIRARCPNPASRIDDLAELAGPPGPTGATGLPGPISGILPSGITLRGFYAYSGFIQTFSASPGDLVFYETISFGFSLPATPTVHYIEVGEAAPAECPGSVETPEALPGHLCVYEDGRLNVAQATAAATAGENFQAAFGAIVSVVPTGLGPVSVNGTWAVTAP